MIGLVWIYGATAVPYWYKKGGHHGFLHEKYGMPLWCLTTPAIIPIPMRKEKSVKIRKLVGHCANFRHIDLYLIFRFYTKFDIPVFN